MNMIEVRLSYKFSNLKLLESALTHKSFSHELRGPGDNNEKLEFLGDAVLDLVVGELLFDKYPQDSEGGLSKKRASIVNENVLSEIAISLQLDKLLKLGRGEILTGGSNKPRLLASCFEALIGAIFLDSGYEVVRKILTAEFKNRIENQFGVIDFERDYKTRLQELVQKSFRETPKYELVSEEGLPHDRLFLIRVLVKDEVWAQGHGRSKKIAEQEAAKLALQEHFGEIV
jgi:ribonuclease-3